MQAFRDLIKGWLGKTILYTVIVLFVLLGAQGALTLLDRPDPPVVVNGEPISDLEIQRETEITRQSILQRMGENADPSSIDAERIKQKAIDGLIKAEVIRQSSRADGLFASPAQISSKIQSTEVFKLDGVFSEELFERQARNLGYTSFQLFNKVGDEIVLTQYAAGLGGSAFVSTAELKDLVALQKQKRDVAYTLLTTESFEESVEITDEMVQAHFDKNPWRYMTPEKAKAEYLEITVDDFVDSVEITDAEIEAEFDLKVKRLKEVEERRSSHILAEIAGDQNEGAALEKITLAENRIKAGEDFATVAKELSDDSGSKTAGGDLDFASRGAFFPEYEAALFELANEEVSSIVQTDYGFHLIKLTGIRKPDLPVYAEESEAIEAELLRAKAENVYYEKLEEVRTVAFETSDLLSPAEILGKSVETTDWIGRSGNQGVFANQQLIKALFAEEVLIDGQNSDVIEIGDGSAYVVRVTDHKPESAKLLAEVSDEIQAYLKNDRAAAAAQTAGLKIIEALKGGEATTSVLADHKDATWTVKESLERRSPELDFDIAQEAFKLPKPEVGGKSVGGTKVDGGFAVIVVSNVQAGVFDLSENEASRMKLYIANQHGQADLRNFVEYQRQQVDIEIN